MLRAALVAIPFVAGCGGQTRSGRPSPTGPDEAAAGEPATPIVVDVAALEQRLAGEKLAGTVIVMHGDHLYPTASAARAAAKRAPMRPAGAARVVADHGDVVEVETGGVDDCFATWFTGNVELRAFVPRSALVARLAAARTRTFSDGTAIAIDPGAPVNVDPTGLSLDGFLASSPSIALAPDELVLSIRAAAGAAQLPAAPGPRLACDDDFRGTKDEWIDWYTAKQAAEPGDDSDYPDPRGYGYHDDYSIPWCGIVDTYYEWNDVQDDAWGISPPPQEKHAAAPTLDGHAVAQIPDGYDATAVYASGDGAYVADLHDRCEHARVAVVRDAVRYPGVGAAAGGGWGGPRWSSEPGAATWPDGTPAGAFTSAETYDERELELLADGRACVYVEHVASRVCHAKKDIARDR
jgi:hypothetical protein